MRMKRLFTKTVILGLLSVLAIPVCAQQWSSHHGPQKQAAAPLAASDEPQVYLGYAKTTDYIYPYDGLSVDQNIRVGCAMVLTPDMLRPYAGGVVKGMMVGWDTYDSKGSYDCFVKKAFHGEKLAGKSAASTVAFGWNTIAFDQTYTIPDNPDSLLVGFYTDLKKDVIAIPTLYPHGQANSCYLWRNGENDQDGNEVWTDAKDVGTLPIILIVGDEEGKFASMVSLDGAVYDRIGIKDSVQTMYANVSNLGSAAVKKLAITTEAGDNSVTHEISLSKSIDPGVTRRVTLPIGYLASGKESVYVDAVNDKANALDASFDVNVLAVPREVANRYKFVPLVEYFESENSCMSPRYYEEILAPGLAGYKGRIIQISQHMDDQFATGEDDATKMSLDFCNGDSLSVELPCMALDRSYPGLLSSYINSTPVTPLFSVLYPDFAKMIYDAELKRPTFASVGGSAKIDNGQISVTVDGDIAKGVLAEGDPSLRLTAYLMERGVESNSQMFWSDDDKEAHEGVYTHACLIREVLSDDIYGDPVEEGDYSKTFTTELDPSWNADSLYVVAFVDRGLEYTNFNRQVINAAEIQPESTSGISSLTSETAKRDNAIYDLSGRRVAHPAKGIYVKHGKKYVVR